MAKPVPWFRRRQRVKAFPTPLQLSRVFSKSFRAHRCVAGRYVALSRHQGHARAVCDAKAQRPLDARPSAPVLVRAEVALVTARLGVLEGVKQASKCEVSMSR